MLKHLKLFEEHTKEVSLHQRIMDEIKEEIDEYNDYRKNTPYSDPIPYKVGNSIYQHPDDITIKNIADSLEDIIEKFDVTEEDVIKNIFLGIEPDHIDMDREDKYSAMSIINDNFYNNFYDYSAQDYLFRKVKEYSKEFQGFIQTLHDKKDLFYDFYQDDMNVYYMGVKGIWSIYDKHDIDKMLKDIYYQWVDVNIEWSPEDEDGED